MCRNCTTFGKLVSWRAGGRPSTLEISYRKQLFNEFVKCATRWSLSNCDALNLKSKLMFRRCRVTRFDRSHSICADDFRSSQSIINALGKKNWDCSFGEMLLVDSVRMAQRKCRIGMRTSTSFQSYYCVSWIRVSRLPKMCSKYQFDHSIRPLSLRPQRKLQIFVTPTLTHTAAVPGHNFSHRRKRLSCNNLLIYCIAVWRMFAFGYVAGVSATFMTAKHSIRVCFRFKCAAPLREQLLSHAACARLTNSYRIMCWWHYATPNGDFGWHKECPLPVLHCEAAIVARLERAWAFCKCTIAFQIPSRVILLCADNRFEKNLIFHGHILIPFFSLQHEIPTVEQWLQRNMKCTRKSLAHYYTAKKPYENAWKFVAHIVVCRPARNCSTHHLSSWSEY